MTLEVVTLKLPRRLLEQSQAVARTRGITVGEMVRQFLADETDEDLPTHPSLRRAKLLRQLGPCFGAAKDWQALKTALSAKGLTLRPQGTGLAIYKEVDGKHLCNTATVGHRYRKLVKRFGAPMPGHPHGARWLKSENAADKRCGALAADLSAGR